jgi:hypothetical protein
LERVAEPSAEHVAGFVVTIGTAGVINCAAMLKVALGTEVQVPLPAVTV